MRTTLRTALVAVTAAAAAVLIGVQPGVAATAAIASAPWCGTDICTGRTTNPVDRAVLTGLTNKLNALLDELPNAGVGRSSFEA